MKILIAGDTHGNLPHIQYLYQRAVAHSVDMIVQVGDFGFWEHTRDGAAYLDGVAKLADSHQTPLCWLDGNHENHTLLRSRYGPQGEQHKPTVEGFWTIRPRVFYLPRGVRWEWDNYRFMALGGAYSVDKEWRVREEVKHHADHTLWWPEEEIDQTELDCALRDGAPLDVLLTHDKPRQANPRWNRKNFLECYPNQDKIAQVVKKHTPKLLVHGHLHFRYDDEIKCADDKNTRIVGLACDQDIPKKDSWIILDTQG